MASPFALIDVDRFTRRTRNRGRFPSPACCGTRPRDCSDAASRRETHVSRLNGEPQSTLADGGPNASSTPPLGSTRRVDGGRCRLLAAQTTAPPEGWVVLPVDEYRALRERAILRHRRRPRRPGRRDADARRLRPARRRRRGRRPRAADDRRPARRLDARADSRRADGARRAARRPAGVARRRPAAARAARRAPAASCSRSTSSLPLAASAGTESIALPAVAVADFARHARAAEERRRSVGRPAASSPSTPRRRTKAAGRRSAGRTSR